jgi:sugar phosphate permease
MASLSGVRPEDSGAASSMVNVMQQVGGSLGLAILVSAAGRPAAGHAAVVHGMSSAFTLAAVLDVLAFLVILTVMRARPGGIGNTATNE